MFSDRIILLVALVVLVLGAMATDTTNKYIDARREEEQKETFDKTIDTINRGIDLWEQHQRQY